MLEYQWRLNGDFLFAPLRDAYRQNDMPRLNEARCGCRDVLPAARIDQLHSRSSLSSPCWFCYLIGSPSSQRPIKSLKVEPFITPLFFGAVLEGRKPKKAWPAVTDAIHHRSPSRAAAAAIYHGLPTVKL
ncbi:hypothetical protein EYF80_012463 [Liparis tanakae]|uniref:Uncharacterized protein n=1 Tax=Liparis tanakae TaxID=230148 RepID=A0A4Z2IH56_9TELE|nr:hypothetical protein EYF80_012463 [Liparis tanakae]